MTDMKEPADEELVETSVEKDGVSEDGTGTAEAAEHEDLEQAAGEEHPAESADDQEPPNGDEAGEELAASEDSHENAEQSGPAGASGKQRGMGIGGRLLLSVLAIFAATVGAIAVGWISMTSSSNTMSVITDDKSPAVADALRLSETVARITSIAPALVAARTNVEREDIAAGLKSSFEQFSKIVEKARIGKDAMTDLLSRADQLKAQLGEIENKVKDRNKLAQSRAAAMNKLRALHKEIAVGAAAIIDDVTFNLSLGAENVDGTQPGAVLEFVESGVEPLSAAMNVKAEANQIVGLLGNAATETQSENLQPLRERFIASKAQFIDSMFLVNANGAADELQKKGNALVAIGEGEGNVFDIRIKELTALDEIVDLMTKTRQISAEFSDDIAIVVDEAETGMAEEAAAAEKSAELNKKLLMFLAVFALLITAAVYLMYVRRLVARLVTLSDNMVALADGNLTVEVDRHGTDEVAAMAGTVQVFKENAQEVTRMASARETEDRRNRRRLRSEVLALNTALEEEVAKAVDLVKERAGTVENSARMAADLSQSAHSQASTVASAAEEATINVQTVASAAEELSAS
ncbi:MAG: HAMP domain-containing protein, partial [Rhodospirillales bacterium]